MIADAGLFKIFTDKIPISIVDVMTKGGRKTNTSGKFIITLFTAFLI